VIGQECAEFEILNQLVPVLKYYNVKVNMLSQHQRMFLQEKVMELEQALFFNVSQGVLKLPTSIVNALHVDEVGQVWFMVHRPSQRLNEFEREFGGRLEFYKKGKSFFLHAQGRASIVIDPEDINNAFHLPIDIRNQVSTTMVLIKLKITEMHYYPHKVKPVRFVNESPKVYLQPLAIFKTLQYIVKDIIPVFQSH
jgi:hypothetical protein